MANNNDYALEYHDANGNTTDMYIKTKASLVEGLSDAIASDTSVQELQTRLDTEMSDVKEDLSDKVPLTLFYIQDYDGETLEDKLHNCLDYLIENKKFGTIVCSDEIEITKSYFLSNGSAYGSQAELIQISGARFVLNQPIFTGSERIFCPTFNSCEFKSSNGTSIFDDEADASYVNPGFINCVFSNACILNNISYAANTRYVQSLRIINCKFFSNNSDIIKIRHIIDGLIVNSQFEAGRGTAITITGNTEKCVISNCVIEGFTDNCPLNFNRATSGLVIEKSYFESNTPYSIHIGEEYFYDAVIRNNYFVPGGGTEFGVHTNQNLNITYDGNLVHVGAGSTEKFLAYYNPASNYSGTTSNTKYVGGVRNERIFKENNTRKITNGYISTTNGWYKDSEDQSYKIKIKLNSSIMWAIPSFFGILNASDNVGTGRLYTLSVAFMVQILGTYDSNRRKEIIKPIVTPLGIYDGDGGGIHNDRITITAELDEDTPMTEDTKTLTITVNPHNPEAIEEGTYFTGRVLSSFEIASSMKIFNE